MKRLLAVTVILMLAVAGAFGQETQSADGRDAESGSTGSAEQGAAASSASGSDPALVAVGSLGASNLYFSYVVLGAVADGFATRGYSAEMAKSLAQEAVALNRGSRNALRDLLQNGGLTEADRTVLTDMIEAHELLIKEAEGLMTYVDDRSKTEEFQRYRSQAWEQISKVLGISDSENAPASSSGAEADGGSGSSQGDGSTGSSGSSGSSN
jgi:hypothetical protein